MRGYWRHPFLIALTLLMALISIWSPAGAGHIPSTPVTTTSDATFQTSGQSMWAPGTAIGPGIDTTFNLLSSSWNQSGSTPSSIQHVHIDIPGIINSLLGIGDIDTHFGGSLSASTSGTVGVSSRFHNLGSGSVNVTYPVRVVLTAPGVNSFKPGDTITIGSNVTLLPGWSLMTAPPQGTIDVIGTFGLAASASAETCFFSGLPCPTNGFLNLNIPTSNGNIVSANSTISHTFSFVETFLTGISGSFGLPNIATTASLDGNSIIATGAHKFVDLNVDLDSWATKVLGVASGTFVPPLGITSPSIAGVQIGYETADVGVDVNMTQA